MFMNDVQLDQSSAELYVEPAIASSEVPEAQAEADDFQTLLTTVDAARAGLASDEHDYDYTEEEAN